MSWKKVKLSEILERSKNEVKKILREDAVRAFPIFVVYTVSIIFLLKLSQIVLGWSF